MTRRSKVGSEETGAESRPAVRRSPSPNVRLGAEASPLGAGPVTVGTKVLCVLPDAAGQRAGFYCEDAPRLVRLYPGRFKLIVKRKGQ